MKTYYVSELNKVTPKVTIYPPTFKIYANGNGEDTKHISLNKESALVLINWLTNNFLNEYMVRDREAGNIIAMYRDEKDAIAAIAYFEAQDILNECFIPNFYEVKRINEEN